LLKRNGACCICGGPHSVFVLISNRTLLAGMVDGILPRQDDLRDGEESVAVLKQLLDDAGQGFGGVLGGVVEENDGTDLDFGGDPFGDLGS